MKASSANRSPRSRSSSSPGRPPLYPDWPDVAIGPATARWIRSFPNSPPQRLGGPNLTVDTPCLEPCSLLKKPSANSPRCRPSGGRDPQSTPHRRRRPVPAAAQVFTGGTAGDNFLAWTATQSGWPMWPRRNAPAGQSAHSRRQRSGHCLPGTAARIFTGAPIPAGRRRGDAGTVRGR